MQWIVRADVVSVHGYQEFIVEAASSLQARNKFIKDGGEFVCEEVEVTSLVRDAELLDVTRADTQHEEPTVAKRP